MTTEEIQAEIDECKVIVDELWAVYLDKTQQHDTVASVFAAWHEYKAGLDQHGICPTLIGYRYRKNLKYGQRQLDS